MSEKAANVQRKTLKDIQKAQKDIQRTIAQDHFKRLQGTLVAWKETERNEGWIRSFYRNVHKQGQIYTYIHIHRLKYTNIHTCTHLYVHLHSISSDK